MNPDSSTLIVLASHHLFLYNLNPICSVPNNMHVEISAALHTIKGFSHTSKSTKIKMLGLRVIMARSGWSVLSECATLRVMDLVLSSFKTNGEITVAHSNNHSGKEMSEMGSTLIHISVNIDFKTEEITSDIAQYGTRMNCT